MAPPIIEKVRTSRIKYRIRMKEEAKAIGVRNRASSRCRFFVSSFCITSLKIILLYKTVCYEKCGKN